MAATLGCLPGTSWESSQDKGHGLSCPPSPLLLEGHTKDRDLWQRGKTPGEQEPGERHRVCSLMKTAPCAYVRACVCVLMAHRPFTDLVDLCFCLFY